MARIALGVARTRRGAGWLQAATLVAAAAAVPYVRRHQGRVALREDLERTRLELLYAVAAAGENLDVGQAATALAEALAPALGDWVLVALLDADGALETVAVSRSGTAERDRLVQDLLERYPIEVDKDSGVGLALRTGQRIEYSDVNDELLSTSATTPEQLDMLRALQLGSAVVEPLIVRGRVVGAVGCINRSGRGLAPTGLKLLEEVSTHAAAVMHNATLHRDLTERDRALRFSEALLRAQGEAGVEGLLVVSPEGEMLTSNSRFAVMWGFGDDDLAQGLDEVAVKAAMRKVADPEAFEAGVRAAYEDPSGPTRDEILLIDGRVFDRYGAPLRFDDGTYVGWAWYFRDVTQARQTQQSLAESGERFAVLARTLQESLLPPALPDIPGAEVAARYHPAGDGSEIGGDFYDVFQIDDREWCAITGDVCGKGAAAARLTALARYTFRATVTQLPLLADNFHALNRALLRQAELDRDRNEHRFATAVAVRLRVDAGTVRVEAGSAGHPAPLLLTADGEVGPIACRGSLLGMFERVGFQTAEVSLSPGDVVVMYTDGVTEAQRGRELFGEERLLDLLRRHAGSTASEVAGAVEEAVLRFQDGSARDDIAVVAIRAADAGDGAAA